MTQNIRPLLAVPGKTTKKVAGAGAKRLSNLKNLQKASTALGNLDLRAMPREHLPAARQLRDVAEKLSRDLEKLSHTRER